MVKFWGTKWRRHTGLAFQRIGNLVSSVSNHGFAALIAKVVYKQGKSEGFDSCDWPKFDPNHRFFSPCDFEIWCMISKNNRAPLLYYIKLCVSFQIHRWIQTEVTLRKRSIRVEIGDFLSLVTLKFDGWPWKTIGHLFYTTSSFVHHFKSIGELKVKL